MHPARQLASAGRPAPTCRGCGAVLPCRPPPLRSLFILFAADGDARGRGDGNDSDRCCRLPAARGRGWLIAHRKTVYVRAMAQRGGAGG